MTRDEPVACCLAKAGAWLDEPWERRYGWNTIAIDGLPQEELRELVDMSYEVAVAALPRAKRPS